MGLPSIAGYIASASNTESLYRYTPVKTVKNVYITKKVTVKPTKADVDKNIIIQLGGPFAKVGEQDEAIGGGSQKVGTGN